MNKQEIGIRNAIIAGADIDFGRGVFLDAHLTLKLAGGGYQGFGGYCLGKKGEHVWNGYAHAMIQRIMEVAEVEEWSALIGKPVRIKGTPDGIVAIGHVLNEDWFEPAVVMQQIRNESVGMS
jgi:hypothetical protein